MFYSIQIIIDYFFYYDIIVNIMDNNMKQTNKQTNKHFYIYSSFTFLSKFILVAKNILINQDTLFVLYEVINENKKSII